MNWLLMNIARLAVLFLCFSISLRLGYAQTAGDAKNSQVVRDERGLYTLDTPRVTLVSDIPFDDELKSWPGLLEQSLEQWQTYFAVDAARMSNWKIKAYLMGSRERFAQLGLLNGVPAFDEGYQFGDTIYVREQPTAYYRRLLFLHEATHWIVWKLYGGGGSTWFMEGMAEMQGTHDLANGVLKLSVIPASSDRVAGWGRLRLIDETLVRKEAPSMEEIFAYGNARENHEKRYSWSWAACVFFTNHPKYGPILKELYKGGLDYSQSLSIKFRKRLEPDWNEVLLEWNAFVSDLDFGYDFSRSSVSQVASSNIIAWSKQIPSRITLAADRGWQPTGLVVEAGKPIQISCEGSYQLKGSSQGSASTWVSEPCGITYQYYRGNPLGCVIAAVVSSDSLQKTERWQTLRVGNNSTVDSPTDGRLYLKVNEPSSELKDNAGTVNVELSAPGSR